MGDAASNTSPFIMWGVAEHAIPGETESGDQYLVESFEDGVMVSVVDGLGHGPQAFAVAKKTVEALQGHASEPVDTLIQRCHKALRRTRGVVMSLAAFNARKHVMTWVGIGNVRGVLLHTDPTKNPARESLLLRGGVVGYNLPTPRVVTLPVTQGDTLIFATDGIRSGFATEVVLSDSPQNMADRILENYGRGTDDTLVLVVRYLGHQD